jgi:hypothetical protein
MAVKRPSTIIIIAYGGVGVFAIALPRQPLPQPLKLQMDAANEGSKIRMIAGIVPGHVDQHLGLLLRLPALLLPLLTIALLSRRAFY